MSDTTNGDSSGNGSPGDPSPGNGSSGGGSSGGGSKALKRYGPIVLVLVIIAAVIAIASGGDDDKTSNDATGTTNADNSDLPITYPEAVEAGTEGDIDWGEQCDTELGLVKVPISNAAPCVEPWDET